MDTESDILRISLTGGLSEHSTRQICEVAHLDFQYPMNEDSEIQEGIEILESVWYLLANRIVEMAIQVYNLDTSQASALREVYLKQNNYYVVLQS